MLGQTEYGQWYQLQILKNGRWENVEYQDGGTMKLFNLDKATKTADHLRQSPGISDVMVVKVEASIVYDIATRQRMVRTVFTGIWPENVSRETID